MNTDMAVQFLTRCFAPHETIAILLRRECPARIVQRIVPVEKTISAAYIRWLAHQNASGMNVYVAANPLRSGSRKRTKGCIAEVRHVYLDIDCDGEARLAALEVSDAVPKPNAIISTSTGKFQVLWRVKGFDFTLQESTLKRLAIAFGGDPACTDCNRVIRLPGFDNTKYTPAHPVGVEYLSESTYRPEDFRIADRLPEIALTVRSNARQMNPRIHTHSEQDWAWFVSKLTSGTDAAQLTLILAERRADKPNPLYYAQRTVDIASARLALLAGSSIHQVARTLEARRRAELPAAVCSARAREIAQTAAHMIARKKLA